MKQLLVLVRAIEKSTFFQIQDAYSGNPNSGLTVCVDHGDAKTISVTASRNTKAVYFFLGCGYGEFAPLAKFIKLYQKIEWSAQSVKITEIPSRYSAPATK